MDLDSLESFASRPSFSVLSVAERETGSGGIRSSGWALWDSMILGEVALAGLMTDLMREMPSSDDVRKDLMGWEEERITFLKRTWRKVMRV